jgi:hypothetical protein
MVDDSSRDADLIDADEAAAVIGVEVSRIDVMVEEGIAGG